MKTDKIRINCNYCPQTFVTYNSYLIHFTANHPGKELLPEPIRNLVKPDLTDYRNIGSD